MLRKKINIFIILIGITTLFLGIAYASISNVSFDIDGIANIKKNELLEITSVELEDSNNAYIDKSKIINISNTMMNSKIVLNNNEDAYIKYKVIIHNNTHTDLNYIQTIKNDEFYDNDNIIFEIQGIDQYQTIPEDEDITFYIIFKYKDNYKPVEDNELNSYLNFQFRQIFNIEYENIANSSNYPSFVIEDESLSITFTGTNIPENINILKDNNALNRGTDFSYKNNTLTFLNSIDANIVIQGIEVPKDGDIYTSNVIALKKDDSITLESYLEDYTLDDVSSTYLHYTVNSNVVTKVESCKKFSVNADSICLTSDDSSKYEFNKNLIADYFDNLETKETCDESLDNGITRYSCTNEYIMLSASSDGSTIIKDFENNTSCEINASNRTYNCS